MNETQLGNVMIYSTDNGNHPPEQWAEMAVNKIIQVGDNSHPVIVDQARAFRDQIHLVLTQYFRSALEAERAQFLRRM